MQNQRREDQLVSLKKEFGYEIGLTSWKQLVKRLKIPTVRTQKLLLATVEKAVVDEVGKDPTQSRGPDFIQDQLRLKMILPPRDLIRKIMLDKFPDGFDNRFPGKKGKRVTRVPLHALGPYMASRTSLRTIFSFSKFTQMSVPEALVGISSSTLYKRQDIPIQLTTDKGSEVGWLYAFMSTLREIYAADIDKDLYPFHVLIKSIHNTVIEGFWRQLKEKLGLNLKDFLLRGKIEHLFNAHDLWHEQNWTTSSCGGTIIEFVTSMKKYYHPDMSLPMHWSSLSCLGHWIVDPQEAIDNVREQLTEEEGPQEDYQTWPGLTPEFNVYAADVYSRIGGARTHPSQWMGCICGDGTHDSFRFRIAMDIYNTIEEQSIF
ncbi:hypothetical protein B0H14DRAFT_2634186 [Mycena olivaceomarginata]|nr:hypothetical protein B0H14DRAFT_2634186 [Mycena olivaceomarginata]